MDEGTYVPILEFGAGLMQTREPNPRASWSATNRDAGTRRCWDCGEWKPLEAFHRNSSGACGRSHRCAVCVKADVKRRRAEAAG